MLKIRPQNRFHEGAAIDSTGHTHYTLSHGHHRACTTGHFLYHCHWGLQQGLPYLHHFPGVELEQFYFLISVFSILSLGCLSDWWSLSTACVPVIRKARKARIWCFQITLREDFATRGVISPVTRMDFECCTPPKRMKNVQYIHVSKVLAIILYFSRLSFLYRYIHLK